MPPPATGSAARAGGARRLTQVYRYFDNAVDVRAVLYPAIAEAAHRVGANAVGLIAVGSSAALNLQVDRVGIAYSNGQSLGDPSSPVQLSCSVVGRRPIPARAIPAVVSRIGVDHDPLDLTDPEDARWLRAALPPDQPDRAQLVARLDAEIALAAAAPPVLLQGEAVELLPDAFARVAHRRKPRRHDAGGEHAHGGGRAALQLIRRQRLSHADDVDVEDHSAGLPSANIAVDGLSAPWRRWLARVRRH
jgi:hypothetical protein